MAESGPSTPRTVYHISEVVDFEAINQIELSNDPPSADDRNIEGIDRSHIITTGPSTSLDDDLAIEEIVEPSEPLRAQHNPDGLFLRETFYPRPSFVATVWGLLKKGATSTSRIIIPKSPGTNVDRDPALGIVTTVYSHDSECDGDSQPALQRPALPPRPPIPTFAPTVTGTPTSETKTKPEGERQDPETPDNPRQSHEIRRSRLRIGNSPSPGHTPKTIDSPSTLLSQPVTKSAENKDNVEKYSPTPDKTERRASLRKSISLRSLRGSLRALPTSLQMTGRKDKKPEPTRDSLPQDPADIDDNVEESPLNGVSPIRYSTPVDIPPPLPVVLQSIDNEFSSSILGEIQKREAEASPDPFMIAQSVHLTTDPNPPPPATFSFKVPFRRPTVLDRPRLYPVVPHEVDDLCNHLVLPLIIDNPAPEQRFYIEDAPDAFGDATPSDYDPTEEVPIPICEVTARSRGLVESTSPTEGVSSSRRSTPCRCAELDASTLQQRLARFESKNEDLTPTRSFKPGQGVFEEQRSCRDPAVSLSHIYVNHVSE